MKNTIKQLLRLTIAAFVFGIAAQISAQAGSPFLDVTEGKEYTYQKFFELPGAEKTYSHDTVVSKVEQSRIADDGASAYISNFLGDASRDLWVYVRGEDIFLNGQGYVQAFRFGGLGTYKGAFDGGVKGKSPISIERDVRFESRGLVFNNCIRFTQTTDAGQTEVVFAPGKGPICVRDVLTNGAASGYELIADSVVLAKAP